MTQPIKLSKQTKTLFAQIIMKILAEKAVVSELLDALEFQTDHENLLHCLNPPSVSISWDDLEDASVEEVEPEEDFFGVEDADL